MEGSLKKHEKDLNIAPSGIGGWLIVILIGLILHAVILYVRITRIYLPFLAEGKIETFSSILDNDLLSLLSFLSYYEFISNIVLLIALVVLLTIFFQQKRTFPRVFFWFLIMNMIFILIDEMIADQILAGMLESKYEGPIYKEAAKAVIICAIFIPYIKRSKRVKNTFVK